MLDKEALIEWCWLNLAFNNNPKSWTDTYIIDILNGYKGKARKNDGGIITYSKIRTIFTKEEASPLNKKVGGKNDK